MRMQTQRGMSLIELMIAMVVSLVLMAGVGTVYVSSKRNYQARDQLSLMDESARVALDALSKHLEHAGYATPEKLPMGDYLIKPGDVSGNSLASGACADGNSNIVASSSLRDTADNDDDSTTDYGDTTGIAFIADDELFRDCANAGNDTASRDWSGCRAGTAASVTGALAYNSFFVDTDNSGVANLYCGTSRMGGKSAVVPGIENIQFMYGVDTNLDGSVDKYVNATSVGAGEWQRIISIKVGLLVRSLEPVLPTAEAKSYQVLDVALTRNDRFQRSVYTAVVHLRNVVDG